MNCFKINLEEMVDVNSKIHSDNSFQLSSLIKGCRCADACFFVTSKLLQISSRNFNSTG